MINDHFLNMSAQCLLSGNNIFNKIEDDIINILTFYKGKDEDNIPLSLRSKVNVILAIAKLKKDGNDIESILDSISAVGKYEDQQDFIRMIYSQDISIQEHEKSYEQIQSRVKLISLLGSYPELREFIDDFESDNFDSIPEAINRFEGLISGIHSNISNITRQQAVKKSEELDLLSDDYDHTLEQIEDNYSGKESIPSGFPSLDVYIKQGFQPKRLYIFAGSSGDGKSTLLLNFIKNRINIKHENEIVDGKPVLNCYLYITLENHVDESLSRLYASDIGVDEEKILLNWKVEKLKVQKHFKDKMIKNNVMMKMCYMPPSVTGIEDVMDEVNAIHNRYKDRHIKIKALYIDYLDLLRSGQIFDAHRLELGQVTIDLKLLSVILNTPTITITQLNRSGYDPNVKKNLTMMGESIKKVENADFVAMNTYLSDSQIHEMKHGLQSQSNYIEAIDNNTISKDNGKGKIAVDILKNRCGAKNVCAILRADFAKYKITDPEIETGFVSFNVSSGKVKVVNQTLDVVESDVNLELDMNDNIKEDKKDTNKKDNYLNKAFL